MERLVGEEWLLMRMETPIKGTELLDNTTDSEFFLRKIKIKLIKGTL